MKNLYRLGYAFLWPAVMFVLFESVARGAMASFFLWTQNTPPERLFINFLLFFSLFNLFQFIRRKSLFVLSQLVMTALIMVIAVVSYFKMQLRLEPVLPSDVYLMGGAVDIAKGYIAHFDGLLIGAAIGLALIFFWVPFLLRKKRREGVNVYVPFALSVILAVLGGFYVVQGEAGAVRKIIKRAYENHYSLMLNADYNGAAFQMLEYMADNRVKAAMPADYNQAAIESIVAKTEKSESEPLLRPNIIIVLGESMADLSMLDELTLKADTLPRIHDLMGRFPSNTLTVDTFGGGTYMAESKMLTGMAVPPYGPHRIDTIAWRLKPLGYHSAVVHTYWGWFYDRQAHLKDMGFDLFMPVETFTTTPVFAPYPEDGVLYQQVLEIMDKTKEPDLIFAATMQTHGGYDYDPLYDTPLNETPLNPKAERELNNFLFLQKEADEALGDFMDIIAKRGEPTVVIYFGDHYPSIPLTLEALQLHLDDKRLYDMPYFVYANFDMEWGATPMTPAQLMARVLSALQLPMTTSQRLQLMGDEDALRLIGYDALSGKQYAANMLSHSYQNEGYQIGLVPRVDAVRIINDDFFALEGDNVPWRVLMRVGNTATTVLAQTDGKTAIAPLSKELLEALQKGAEGTICFVNDGGKPFYELPMPLYP